MLRVVLLTIAALVATALLAVAAFVISIAWGEPQWVTTWTAEHALAWALDADVTIGATRGTLLGDFELDDVVVEAPTGERVVLPHARVAIDSDALLEGRVVLREVRLRGLAIDGERLADGRWRWAGLDLGGSAEPTGAPPDDDEVRAQGDAGAGTGDAPVLVLGAFVLEDATLRLAYHTESRRIDARARLDARLSALEWPISDARPWPDGFEARLSEIEVGPAPTALDGGTIEARLVRGAGDEAAAGAVPDAVADGAAAGAPPEAQAEAEALTLSVTITDLTGPSGRIPSGRARIPLSGRLDAPALGAGDARVAFEGIDPLAIAGRDGPASSLSGSADVAWAPPAVSGSIELAPSTLAGVALDEARLRARARFEGDAPTYAIEDASFRAAFAQGRGRLAGRGPVVESLALEGVRVDLGALPEAWRPEAIAGGRVSLDARARGPWSQLRSDVDAAFEAVEIEPLGVLSGRVRAELDGLESARVKALRVDGGEGPVPAFEAMAPFGLSIAGEGVRVRDARLAVAGGVLRVDGRIVPGDRVESLALGADAVDVAQLAAALPDADVGGRISGEVVATGPLATPRLRGRVEWERPRIASIEVDRTTLELAPDPEGPRHDVVLHVEQGGRALLDVQGRLSTRGLLRRPERLLEDASTSADVTMHAVHAQLLAAFAGLEDPEQLGGELSGRARVRGPATAPRIQADFRWEQPAWRGFAAELLSLDVDASDASGATRLAFAIVQEGRTSIRIDADVPDRAVMTRGEWLRGAEGGHLTVHFDAFDLSTLDPLVGAAGVELRGIANGDLKVVGGDPFEANGGIHIDALSISGEGLPLPIGPTPARFDFAGRVVRVSELAFPSAEGTAQIRGQVSWKDPSAIQLQLTGRTDGFRVQVPGVIDGRLDGDVVIAGPPLGLEAEGGLLLRDANIDLPNPRDPIFQEIRVRRPTGPESASIREGEDEGEGSGIYDAASGEVSLTLGRSVWLRGAGAELALGGQLVARKRPFEPAGLYGTVEVVRGRVDFQGKWLRVVSGSAIFDGQPDPDPFIDTTAEHRVREVVVRARLFGRASSLQLELESDPPLPREDQISYLVFDRPTSELNEGDRQSVGAAAATLAGDFALGRLGNEVADEIGVDRIRLGLDDQASPTFEVEKKVHDRVTLRYGRSFGDDGGDRFIVEWRVFRAIFLQGEQTTSGQSAVDVLWRWDF